MEVTNRGVAEGTRVNAAAWGKAHLPRVQWWKRDEAP